MFRSIMDNQEEFMEKKPNVILMFIDDLGYGDLSCFNENSKLKTTNIDGLSDCGIRLTDCHSTSALCTPSRYGLLTGRYNWRSRLKQSVLPGGGDPQRRPLCGRDNHDSAGFRAH